MNGVQYNDTYKSNLMRYEKNIDDKIRKELEKETPDIDYINRLKQAKYITPVFDNCFNCFERFRNPW